VNGVVCARGWAGIDGANVPTSWKPSELLGSLLNSCTVEDEIGAADAWPSAGVWSSIGRLRDEE
jgi:hypothetical protein